MIQGLGPLVGIEIRGKGGKQWKWHWKVKPKWSNTLQLIYYSDQCPQAEESGTLKILLPPPLATKRTLKGKHFLLMAVFHCLCFISLVVFKLFPPSNFLDTTSSGERSTWHPWNISWRLIGSRWENLCTNWDALICSQPKHCLASDPTLRDSKTLLGKNLLKPTSFLQGGISKNNNFTHIHQRSIIVSPFTAICHDKMRVLHFTVGDPNLLKKFVVGLFIQGISGHLSEESPG